MGNQIIPIAKAGEILDISDLVKLQAAARRYGALIVVAGALLYVNVDVFNNGVQSEIQAKAVRATTRASKKGEVGRSIGLLRARITRGPGLIAAKEKAIENAKTDLVKAENNWDRYQAKRKLTELEEQLKRLTENAVKDQDALDKFLGEEHEE